MRLIFMVRLPHQNILTTNLSQITVFTTLQKGDEAIITDCWDYLRESYSLFNELNGRPGMVYH